MGFAYCLKYVWIALLSIVFLTRHVYREIVHLTVQNRSFHMKDFAYLFKMFVNCIVKHCVFDKKCVQGNSLFGSSK